MTERPLSYTECVHRVLQAAPAPITMDALIQAVGEMRPLTAKNVRSTLGNAISQSPLRTSLGDARHWWMPHLLQENRFRLHLSTEDLEQGQLVITDEAMLGLWPSFFGPRSRTRHSLVHVQLVDGPLMKQLVVFLGNATWGFEPCAELATWYKARRARPDDDLILTVLDADASPRRYRLEHQPAGECDEARRQLLRDRLRRQAWLLAQIYEDDDTPKMALIAADALEDDAPLSLEEHPLLRGMVRNSFLNAVGELF